MTILPAGLLRILFPCASAGQPILLTFQADQRKSACGKRVEFASNPLEADYRSLTAYLMQPCSVACMSADVQLAGLWQNGHGQEIAW